MRKRIHATPCRALLVAMMAIAPVAVCAQAPAATDASTGLSRLAEVLKLPSTIPVVLDKGDMLPHAVPGASALDLRDAAVKAREASLEAEAARHRLDSFRYTRNAALGALLPRMELREGVGRGRLSSVDPILFSRREEQSLTLRQALFNEAARQEWVRQSTLTRSAAFQLDSAINDNLLDTGAAFLATTQAAVNVQLSVEYSAMLDDLFRYVNERAKAGGASVAERDRVLSRVTNARTQIADGRAVLAVSLRTLERLVDRPVTAVSLADPGLGALFPSERDRARQLASSANPDLAAANVEREAADVERRGYRARALPVIEVEASTNRNRNVGGLENFTKDSRVIFTATWSLLNGGADYAQMRAATSRRDELDARARDTERRLHQEVDNALTNLASSKRRFSTVSEEVAINLKVVEAFRAQLVEGNRPLLDVLDAYQRYHQSRLDLAQIAVAEGQAMLRVAHFTGQLQGLLASNPAPAN